MSHIEIDKIKLEAEKNDLNLKISNISSEKNEIENNFLSIIDEMNLKIKNILDEKTEVERILNEVMVDKNCKVN
jgi:hypothetical protein